MPDRIVYGKADAPLLGRDAHGETATFREYLQACPAGRR